MGGFRLHLTCEGRGPSVVFDAALGGSSISWSLVQPEVARFARACAYDRAGFGWSDPGPMPRTAGRIFAQGFSTKPDGTGFGRGYGLDTVRRTVTSRGGTIEVGDSALGGARFAFEMACR